jgi:hypothetical protein
MPLASHIGVIALRLQQACEGNDFVIQHSLVMVVGLLLIRKLFREIGHTIPMTIYAGAQLPAVW